MLEDTLPTEIERLSMVVAHDTASIPASVLIGLTCQSCMGIDLGIVLISLSTWGWISLSRERLGMLQMPMMADLMCPDIRASAGK